MRTRVLLNSHMDARHTAVKHAVRTESTRAWRPAGGVRAWQSLSSFPRARLRAGTHRACLRVVGKTMDAWNAPFAHHDTDWV